MTRTSSQHCEQEHWQSPSNEPCKSSSPSPENLANRSEDQRKRLENAISKYRNAARSARYTSKENKNLNFSYKEPTKYCNENNTIRNTSDRTECKNNIECKTSGDSHLHYTDAPTCERKSSKCTNQPKHNNRKSIHTHEEYPCQGGKHSKNINQREYRETNPNRNNPSEVISKILDRCLCSDKPNEKEKVVNCKERERNKDKYKLRETFAEKRRNPRNRNGSQKSSCSYKSKSPKMHHKDRSCHEGKDFERNIQKLIKGLTDKDCHRRKQEDCNQRKQQDKQSKECPIQIRLTARFTPACINEQDTTPTETHQDDDTCCSCCTDDEDSFYTPDSFTASLRDMRGPPRPCNEERNNNSSEPTSNSTSNHQESCPVKDEERPVEYFNKAAKLEETKKQLRRSGLCKYILSPFGSTITSVDNECSKPTVNQKHCNDETGSNNSKETEMYNNFCKEIQTLKEEINRIKCFHQQNQSFSRSEVNCLIKENQCLKKELEEFKENVEEQFQKMLEEKLECKAQQVAISRKNDGVESCCGDKTDLSQGYNEVMDVVTDKLHSVLKRFQTEEKAVCERSTSFTKFTNNYRTIIEEYCRTLSKRINEWFECKRSKFEKREEKLKQDYVMCCSYMETEKQTIRSKVNKINEKIDNYEKYIDWQMKFIQDKYIPNNNSKHCIPEAGAIRSEKPEKTDWSAILEEPNCTNNTRQDIDDRNNYRYIKPRHQTSVDNGTSTKTLYKYHGSNSKRRYSPTCSDCDVSADQFTYTVSHERDCGFPYQNKVHGGDEKNQGKYTIMEKIKEYFDKSHKKPKDYPERTLSVMTLNSDD